MSKLNEEFMNQYNNTMLSKFDLEPNAHIEMDPVMGDAYIGAKKVRQRMKDDFKEQDAEVKKFLSAQELEENPKLPNTNNKAELKAMKLAEQIKRRLKESTLTEATIQDMIDAFEDKIRELEGVNESLTESTKLTEDYSNFIGKPLKDFLKSIPRNTKINIDYEESDDGCSGINGRVFDVPWSVADRLIKDIQLGDDRFYKFKILTEEIKEDKKKELSEARKVSKLSYDDKDESHRYKVVIADTNAKELFVKDVKGIDKVDKLLTSFTDEYLNSIEGATQVYVTRDDDKEIYFKYGNEDGTWEVDHDDRDMERPADVRDTVYNHMVADLCAESGAEIKALRKMDRKGQGYVGFELDEIGFNEDDQKFHLRSQSRKPIEWAKKVAEFYGFTSEEKPSDRNNGYYYIDIYAPGIADDPKLNP